MIIITTYKSIYKAIGLSNDLYILDTSYHTFFNLGVSENVVYPIVPNGFHDQTIPIFNGSISLGIYPTFSDKPM